MSSLLPFASLSDTELLEELHHYNVSKANINNRLSDHGLKNYICNLSKHEIVKSLDSAY